MTKSNLLNIYPNMICDQICQINLWEIYCIEILTNGILTFEFRRKCYFSHCTNLQVNLFELLAPKKHRNKVQDHHSDLQISFWKISLFLHIWFTHLINIIKPHILVLQNWLCTIGKLACTTCLEEVLFWLYRKTDFLVYFGLSYFSLCYLPLCVILWSNFLGTIFFLNLKNMFVIENQNQEKVSFSRMFLHPD